MTGDEAIRRNVLEDLRWSPRVNATHIGVSVRDGVVELTGHVETFAEKLEAEHAALSVKGVNGVAQEILVRLPNESKTSDTELADRAVRLLSWDARLHGEAIKVKVEHGWITLTGQARSSGERDAALSDVKRLSGVVGVTNAITLRPVAPPEDVKGLIEDALSRQSLLKDAIIQVSAQGETIILSGRVHSWAQRHAARATAWAAPGVSDVIDNLLMVSN
jgi:osmotically-inducible protein OsmY